MTVLANRLPFHYAWVMLAAGVLTNAVAAGGTFWMMAIYIPAISDEFELPRFGVVLAFMVGQSISAVVGPFAGQMIDRHGPRVALLVSSVVLPGALIATSFSTELWHLFLGWGVASIARAWMFPISYNWLMTRWFIGGRQQQALGVVTVGFALGGAAILPVLAIVEERSGWGAAMFGSAILILVVHGLSALLIVRNEPTEMGLRPVGGSAETDDAASEAGGFSGPEAIRTLPFWLIATGLMFFFSGQGAVATLAIDFFDSRDVANGASIIAVGAMIRTIARLPLGLAMSRINRVFLLGILVAGTQMIALTVLLVSTTTTGIVAYLVLWGIGGAFAPMLEPLLVTRTFGLRHFGAVSGSIAMVAFGGQMIGPLGGAALYDATGSYTLPFALYGVGFVVTMVLLAVASLRVNGAAHREAARAVGMADRTADAAGS